MGRKRLGYAEMVAENQELVKKFGEELRRRIVYWEGDDPRRLDLVMDRLDLSDPKNVEWLGELMAEENRRKVKDHYLDKIPTQILMLTVALGTAALAIPGIQNGRYDFIPALVASAALACYALFKYPGSVYSGPVLKEVAKELGWKSREIYATLLEGIVESAGYAGSSEVPA